MIHPSVKSINKQMNNNEKSFAFTQLMIENIFKKIMNFDKKKVCQDTDIPTHIF